MFLAFFFKFARRSFGYAQDDKQRCARDEKQLCVWDDMQLSLDDPLDFLRHELSPLSS